MKAFQIIAITGTQENPHSHSQGYFLLTLMLFQVKITLSQSGCAAPLQVISKWHGRSPEHRACTYVQHCSTFFIIPKDSLVHNSQTHNPNLPHTVELYLSKIMRTQQAARFFKESSFSFPWSGTLGPRDFMKYHSSCYPHLVTIYL